MNLKTEYNSPKSARDPNFETEGQNVRRPLTMRECRICKFLKPETDFYKVNNCLRRFCKKCEKENKKLYYQEKKELVKAARRRYYRDNMEKCKISNSEYHKRRRVADENFKLRMHARNQLYQYLTDKRINKLIGYLGCSHEELKAHIEGRFTQGMSWENYGKNGWQIDHIYPLSKCDLTNEEDRKKFLHYSNLQPLWLKDNVAKGSKVL